uniref:Uncharacterized protein n=1 Tax=Octactis speculum TaxID=3111310 RepID=A0A7S2HUP9_9STRA
MVSAPVLPLPREGSHKTHQRNLYNLADLTPAPRDEVLAFAADLLGVPWGQGVGYYADPGRRRNGARAARSRKENKRVRSRCLSGQLGYSLMYPDYRTGLSSLFSLQDQSLADTVKRARKEKEGESFTKNVLVSGLLPRRSLPVASAIIANKAWPAPLLERLAPGVVPLGGLVEVALALWGDAAALLDALPLVPPRRVMHGELLLPPRSDAKINQQQRLRFLRAAALAGDSRAQHTIGLLSHSGFGGVAKNATESVMYHAIAAVQGNFDAVAVLGGCLRVGAGVPINESLGVSFIRASADSGNPAGLNKLGQLREAAGDVNGAALLYQKSAGLGNALGLFSWGYALVYGEGVEKDTHEGETQWRRATELAPMEGSEEAAYFLGMRYISTRPEEGRRWLKIAHDLGFEDATAVLQVEMPEGSF